MIVEPYILAICTKVSFKSLMWEFSVTKQVEEFVHDAPLPDSIADCQIWYVVCILFFNNDLIETQSSCDTPDNINIQI